jgi:hypothetical protein
LHKISHRERERHEASRRGLARVFFRRPQTSASPESIFSATSDVTGDSHLWPCNPSGETKTQTAKTPLEAGLITRPKPGKRMSLDNSVFPQSKPPVK